MQLVLPSLMLTLPVGGNGAPLLPVTAYWTMIVWPTSEGDGACEMIDVSEPYLTLWDSSFDWAGRLYPSPLYVATIERGPGFGNASVQAPAATVVVHDVVPSPTVTLPVGAGPPCGDATTPKLTVTVWPIADGFGVSPVIEICEL